MKKQIWKGIAATSVIAIAASLPTGAALAQDDGPAASDDVIVSVGTRRASRSAASTPAPVDVISADEVLNQGDTDIQNILRTSVPSYNVNTQPISDAATLIRPANLRGLAPDSTLVLINNKRRHRAAVISFLGGGISDGSQGPDISVIPSIALKQVEVLRDGASSQYGSDAIAGVMNFVLKDSDEGASFEAEYGSTYEGDGDQYSISANVGLPIPVAQGGFINISGEYGEIDATSRSVQRTDAAGLIAAGNTAVADPAQIWGQPNINDDWTVFVNSGITLSDQLEVYAFGNYSERQGEGGFFFRNPTNRGGVYAGPEVDATGTEVASGGVSSVLVGNLGTGTCPDGIPLSADGIPDPTVLAAVTADADCFSFVELFPGGFTPRFGGDLEDASIVGGIRGEFANGLGYDVSYSYGRNKATFFINNTINASLGPNTPTSFTPGAYVQTDNNYNLDLTYALANDIFASDLSIAFGAEHREENFEIIAGDPESFEIGPLAAQGFSSSSNGFGGFSDSNAGDTSQKNYAVYLDVETDVTDQLILQAAVRYEDFYDSFGGTTNYKVGALYKATDFLSLRGTYSTGFHAPTAGQANVTNVTTAFSGSILVDQGTLPLSSAAGQFIADRLEASTGFRPELGPEESRNITAGIALSLGGVDITADYFNIDVDNRISISDQQDFLGALETFAGDNGVTLTGTTTFSALTDLDSAGLLNIGDFSGSEDLTSFGFFSNSFDTRTQGVDIVATTDLEFYDGSNTKVALTMNYTDTKVTDTGQDTAAPLSLGRQTQLEDNLPAWRGNMTVNHFHGPFRGLMRLNYFGEFFECHLDALNGAVADTGCDLPIFGGSQLTVDLEAAYSLMDDKVELVVGAQNVFDEVPTLNPFGGVAGSQFPATAPGGYSGGLYYFKIRANM